MSKPRARDPNRGPYGLWLLSDPSNRTPLLVLEGHKKYVAEYASWLGRSAQLTMIKPRKITEKSCKKRKDAENRVERLRNSLTGLIEKLQTCQV